MTKEKTEDFIVQTKDEMNILLSFSEEQIIARKKILVEVTGEAFKNHKNKAELHHASWMCWEGPTRG